MVRLSPTLVLVLCALFVFETCAIRRKTALTLKDRFRVKRCPIFREARNFKELAGRSNAFADKSLLIKEILEDKSTAFLITTPRLWGKRMTMDMMKTFFEIQLDNNGMEIMPINSTQNYQLFVEGRLTYNYVEERFKAPSLIATHEHIVENYLGRHPVIRVNFRFSIWDSTFDSLIRGMMSCISDAFQENENAAKAFEVMLNDTAMDDIALAALQERLEDFERYRVNSLMLLPNDVMESINFLVKFLYDRFSTKVFLLIEEYHAPWERVLISTTISEKNKRRCLKFYKDFLKNLLQRNPYVEKTIITGLLTPYKELYDSVFSRVPECSVATGKFMDYYGFNVWEMREFFKYRRLRVNLHLDELTFWYGGHRVHNRSDLRIYNPWSVIKSLEMKKLNRWWNNLQQIQNLFFTFINVLPFREKILSLVYGHTVTVQLQRPHLTWKEYQVVYSSLHPFNANKTYDDAYANPALMYLLALGFLALNEGSDPSNATYRIMIPNVHTYLFFRARLKICYEDNLLLPDTGNDNKQDLQKSFEQFVYDNNTTSQQFENAYNEYIVKRQNISKYVKDIENDYAEILQTFLNYWLIDMSGHVNESFLPLYLLVNRTNSLVMTNEEEVCWRKEVRMYSQNDTRPSAVIAWDNRTTIIQIQYNKTNADMVLEKAKTYANIVDEITHPIEVIKFIGINIRANGTIRCLAELKLTNK